MGRAPHSARDPLRVAVCALLVLAAQAGCGDGAPVGMKASSAGPGPATTDALAPDVLEPSVTPAEMSPVSHPKPSGPSPRGTAASRPRFVSADPSAPLPSFEAEGPVSAGDAQPAPGIRQVTPGPQSAGYGAEALVVMNRYRGLQLLDLTTSAQPKLQGELPIDAFAFPGVYVVGSQALVLVDGLREYDAQTGQERRRPALLTIDLSAPTAPALVDVQPLPGLVRAAQLFERRAQRDLVVACDRESGGDILSTVLRRFELDGGAPVAAQDLELGDDVTAVAPAQNALLVARLDPDPTANRSSASVVRAGQFGRDMRVAADVVLAGHVPGAQAMSLDGGTLRVLSIRRDAAWQNHLETFAVGGTRGRAGMRLADCTFAEGRSVRAAHFADGRALFVTSDADAPLHVFEIDAQGACVAHPEYGYGAAQDESFTFMDAGRRLIAVGHGGDARHVQVALYDSSSFTLERPLLGRLELEAPSTWREVSWNVGNFKLLEGAATPAAAEGDRGRGLLLVPYAARDASRHAVAGVQTLTVSEGELTPGGRMEHGSPVYESVAVQAGATANVSDSELSLFTHEGDAKCTEAGRVELAPNYSRIFAFGEYIARVHAPARVDEFGEPSAEVALVEVVAPATAGDPGAAVASFEVPSRASLHQVGDLLVALEALAYGANHDGGKDEALPTRIEVHDLTEPRSPRKLASTMLNVPARALQSALLDADATRGSGAPPALSLPHALVLSGVEPHEEVGKSRQVCRTQPAAGCQQVQREGRVTRRCFSGATLCVRLADDGADCLGAIQECDASFEGCGPVQGFVPSTQECTRDYVKTRWSSFEFAVIDLTRPEEPSLARLKMPRTDHALGAWVQGSDLYYTFKEPVSLPDDPRSYAAYAFKRIDLSEPGKPRMQSAVNVPGELLAVGGDALFLRDYAWAEGFSAQHEIALRRAVAPRSERGEPEAELEASLELGQRALANVAALDGDALAYVVPGEGVVVADAASLKTRSRVALAAGHSLAAVHEGRALLSDGRSLTVVDMSDPDDARVSAHHLVRGWANASVCLGGDVFVAAGAYGLQRFGLSEGDSVPPQ